MLEGYQSWGAWGTKTEEAEFIILGPLQANQQQPWEGEMLSKQTETLTSGNIYSTKCLQEAKHFLHFS